MLKSYLLTALRMIRKQKAHAAINIIGLSLGVAAATLIVMFATSELSYDRFHKNADDIYLVYKIRHTSDGAQETYDTWVPLLDRLESEYPAVESGTRVYTESAWVMQRDRRYRVDVTYADPSLFSVFTFPLARQSSDEPFVDNASAVISQQAARTLFGDADPIGRTITVGFNTDYTVSGVLKEIPSNSTLQFGVIVPITSSPDYARVADSWGGSFLETYVQLDPNANPSDLEAQFPRLIQTIWGEEIASRTDFRLEPLVDLNNAQTGNRQYAYILLVIACVTIVIACINFVNLATARSVDRAREIGVRKSLGADRLQLVRQLLAESMVMGAAATVVGVAVARALLPFFNDLVDTQLRLNLLSNPVLLAGIIVVGVGVGLLAGMYPAVFLSNADPVSSLRRSLSARPGGLRMRHGLVVLQFVLSIVLIAATTSMWRQVSYMKSRDIGLDKENVVLLPVSADDFAEGSDAAGRLETFKENLARIPSVRSVSSSSAAPGVGLNSFVFAVPSGGNEDLPFRVRWIAVDDQFFSTFGVSIESGRSFIPGSEADRSESLVINEAAMRAFGWNDIEGKTIHVGRSDYNVVGLVGDYNYDSLQELVAPVLHLYRPPESGVHSFVALSLQTDDYRSTLAAIEAEWDRLDATRAFEYSFMDQTFDRLYRAQDRLVTLVAAFAVLAIVIACLGLLGLASLTVAQRTKEVGVRRVLGASVQSVAILLSRDFLKLVLIAFILAAPIAYFAITRWLEGFAYRTSVGPGVLLFSGVLAALIALATVGTRTIAAAMADPVDSLRYE